jgi:hypothetical protein
MRMCGRGVHPTLLKHVRLKIEEVVMDSGDYPEHTHEVLAFALPRMAFLRSRNSGKFVGTRRGNYCFEGDHIPHAVKASGPVAFRLLFQRLLPEGSSDQREKHRGTEVHGVVDHRPQNSDLGCRAIVLRVRPVGAAAVFSPW